MATITVRNLGKTITASPAISILNTLMREGVDIQHVCGGKAECGTCRIRIVEGAHFMSPIGERERVRLAAIGNPPDTRLACQSYIFRDVVIEIPEKNKKQGSGDA